MCHHHHHHQHLSDTQPSSQHGDLPSAAARDQRQEPFPWHLPIYDAHCHPTDTMSSIASLDTMRASALAIMATRSQDQDLVAQVASLHGVHDGASLQRRRRQICHQTDDDKQLQGQPRCQVIPSFGWHPWFSYQMYRDDQDEEDDQDDQAAAPVPTYPDHAPPKTDTEDAAALRLSAKRAHYQSVLVPAPQDDAFIASLPTPTPLSSFVSATRAKLDRYPVALIGEIGIDKAFRLPESWDPLLASSRDAALTPGGRESRRLSPYKVHMRHQQLILAAQLRLAGQVGRPVSLHGVQAHGVLYDTVSRCWKGHEKHVPSRRERRMLAPGADDDPDGDPRPSFGGKPYPPRICLHSYSGSVEALKQWLRPDIPADIFFSFSAAVNLGTEAARARFPDVVKAVPGHRLLVESDLHVAGEDMDAALEDMYRCVCRAKGWSLEEGVRTMGENFERFVLG
ncbi:hypothetical protein E4U42_004116 [Claviceps africana]|uniref:Cut9 interacting protein Scn1 n=1 Tax=Claviceps africana TaxID=83212 RepID=A0A8K0J5X5_9HYPO|nr:hypothetical protein E4U42_004116 [Claviceps africana]